jgi:hypothetical protein
MNPLKKKLSEVRKADRVGIKKIKQNNEKK